MGKSDYSIEDLYGDIYNANGYFKEGHNGSVIVPTNYQSIHKYCRYENNQRKCRNYFEAASSGVIHLLKKLKDTHKLEDDKLAEYAILFLSYKLNRMLINKSTDLNDFYTNYIEKNMYYNEKIKDNGPTYKEIIDNNIDLMNIKDIIHFNHPFSLLCNLYKMTKSVNWFCNFYLSDAIEFANSFKARYNHSNNKEGSSYRKLLSTISNDYGYLKKKCVNFPPIPEIEPKKSLEENTALSSEATSSSSSISTTLIPGLSVVSVIPVFLGIAYKYSLFGVDKLFQRQYLRNKLKKVKKKMKLNI
ncbi:CIR protein PIR protein [Plasmodium vinckei brucechwatti]|uniref:CIR protein PIR protein n=1 Tax=Plasmodium vinckei brucechwatti TaxID=119398 RepID=A0A6V7RV07_PLAVN|nr:CIR protein PIR protein [Plasmodium vinckei brucechwatti]